MKHLPSFKVEEIDLNDINIALEQVSKEIKSMSNGYSNDSEEEESEVVTRERNRDDISCSDAGSATDDSKELIAE